MSTHRCQNYEKIRGTLLLDREETLLREHGARTKDEVVAFWTARYPHAKAASRELITAELFNRLNTEKPDEPQAPQTLLSVS